MSDSLFAHSSFWTGAARVFDLGGAFDDYDISGTPAEADGYAMQADWLAAGRDLAGAMSELEPADLSSGSQSHGQGTEE